MSTRSAKSPVRKVPVRTTVALAALSVGAMLGAPTAEAGPAIRAASKPVLSSPHDISGDLIRSNIEATDFELSRIFHDTRDYSLRNWRERMLRTEGRPLPASSGRRAVPRSFILSAGIGELVHMLGETSFGIGAIMTRAAGCDQSILEEIDLGIIMSMEAGGLEATQIGTLRRYVLKDAEAASFDRQPAANDRISRAVYTHFRKQGAHPSQRDLPSAYYRTASHFGEISAHATGILEDGESGKRVKISPDTANRFAEEVIYRIYQAGSHGQKPFYGLGTAGRVRDTLINSVAQHAETYYREKAKLCHHVDGGKVSVSERRAVDPASIANLNDLTPGDRRVMSDWLTGLRRDIHDKIRYPQAAKRRGEEGAARIAVTVRRDGTVMSWRFIEETGHERLDGALQKAMRRIRRVDSFPSGFDDAIAEYEVPVEFKIGPDTKIRQRHAGLSWW